MTATYLQTWQQDQHDDQALPADVHFTIWLAGLQHDDVVTDQAAHMQPDEIALMRQPRRNP